MKEYVDRDEAIRATDGELTITGEENMAEVAEYITGVVEKLKALPGQPEIIKCRECKHWNKEEHYCCDFMTQDEDGFCTWAERREE